MTPKQILLLGGTVFLGRAVAEAARNHTVTMLTRGLTQPHLFPDVEHIHADRDGGLQKLAGRRWDAIIDTCGFVPRVVAQSLALHGDRYVFVSSVSAYADLSHANDEDAPIRGPAPDEDVDRYYGALKADCERLVRERGGTVVRPGLIGGPHDPTGRFSYWPVRLAEGGRVLAPGPASAMVQVIDVRDLANWLVFLATEGPAGTYNATGDPTAMGAALQTIQQAVGGDATLCWVENLTEVEPWSEMPLWVGDGPGHAGMMRTPNTRAKAAGLRLRPLAETARDTLAWARTLVGDPPRQADGRYQPCTLSREKEREILARILSPLGQGP